MDNCEQRWYQDFYNAQVMLQKARTTGRNTRNGYKSVALIYLAIHGHEKIVEFIEAVLGRRGKRKLREHVRLINAFLDGTIKEERARHLAREYVKYRKRGQRVSSKNQRRPRCGAPRSAAL